MAAGSLRKCGDGREMLLWLVWYGLVVEWGACRGWIHASRVTDGYTTCWLESILDLGLSCSLGGGWVSYGTYLPAH